MSHFSINPRNFLLVYLNLGLVLFFTFVIAEYSEGSADTDFSPTAQNDEFLDTPSCDFYLIKNRLFLLNGYGFRQISRLIYIRSFQERAVISKKLQRHD